MRILHVISSTDRRGSQIFASDLAHALKDAGVDQRVVSLRGSAGPATSFSVPCLTLRSPEHRQRRLEPSLAVALRRSIRLADPDVVQAHGGETLKYLVPAMVGIAAPLVYRRIGSTPTWATSRGQRMLHAALARRADMVVAVSEATREETIREMGVAEDRVVTIPNGVNLDRVTARRGREEVRAELGVGSEARLVASVGALTWEKDPVGLVRVVADVASDVPEAIFLIVGDGPLRRDVELAVHRAGLVERVRLLGVRDDVPDVLGASDLLLLASATEGMPAVVIEAGALGVPVAAYAVGGVPEVVSDGRTGLLAPARDREQLADRVRRLLRDDGLRTAMGREARARSRTRFHVREIAPAYVEVYRRLADPERPEVGVTERIPR